MRTHFSLFLAVLLAVGALAGSPAAASAGSAPSGAAGCAIETLDVPPDTESSRITAGDPSGRHLVGSVYPVHASETPVVWHDGVPQALDVPLTGVELTAVSRDGTVVGFGQPSGPHRAFVVTPDGEYVQLGSSASRGTFATGISDDGTVAGYLDSPGFPITPVVWLPGAYDQPVDLETSTEFTTATVGMSSNGWVAAATFRAEPERSYRWDPNLQRKRLRGTSRAVDVTVNAVADEFAAGYQVDPETDELELLRWRLKTGRPTVVDAPGSEVRAVNKKGHLVTWDGAAHLVTRGEVVTLPPLVEDRGYAAETLSTRGVAAGYAAREDGSLAAVRWTCG